MASAVTEEDNRKVQTAVLGGSQGHQPVFLPFEKDDAQRLRQLRGADAFTCGVLLGGCGQVLTLRACGDRKSHFAHRPPVRCRRTAVGENSADHLYIGEALVRWLRGQGQPNVTVAYVQQAHARSDSIEIRFGPKGRRRLLHVQMVRRSFSEWKDDRRRLEAASGRFPTIRAYGSESELSPYEVQAAGYALRFRCETRDGTREVSIGTQSPDHQVRWTILERCRLSDLGVVTPSLEAAPGGDVLRLKTAEGAATSAPQPRRQTTERDKARGREEQPPATASAPHETAEATALDEPVDPRVEAARAGLPPVVEDLLHRFTTAGFDLVLVGASVRHALAGSVGPELDFVTDSDVQQVRQIVHDWGVQVRVHRTGTPGVVSLRKELGADSYTIRISACPTPSRNRSSGSRRTEHEKALEAYLRRSDFTIDAMALGLSHVTLTDPFGGLQDLERRVLRSPRAPTASIANDPPLMLRVVRAAARLGFEPVAELRDAMHTMARRVTEVPAEHVREELTATMLAARPSTGLRLLVDTRIAEHVLPELPALRFESAAHHRHKDIYEHTLKVLDQAIALETEGPDLTLRWAALLHDIGTPRTRRTGRDGRVSFHHHEVVGSKMARKRLRALAYPGQLIEDVARLVELHLRFHGYVDERWTDPAVRRYVRDAGPLLDRLHRLTRADCTTRDQRKANALARAYDSLEERIEHLAVEDERQSARPDLNGHQIMEILGIRPGADLGRAYDYMRDLRIEKGPMNFETARDALLEWRARRDR
ncbi:CCA tRNA nucleotidyltransferase [Streptomyces sp. NPDC005271]|uniref:CCA tRNA nucleotidyltransferase n=1 Tax=unclassified Streptomyces TaxID=2593676 RepID=UPI0033B5A9A3